MNGVSGEWDFDIALATKLSDFLKGVKGLGKVIDTVEKYKKIRYLAEQAIKNAGIAKPGIYNIPIPFAGGGICLWGGTNSEERNRGYKGSRSASMMAVIVADF